MNSPFSFQQKKRIEANFTQKQAITIPTDERKELINFSVSNHERTDEETRVILSVSESKD